MALQVGAMFLPNKFGILTERALNSSRKARTKLKKCRLESIVHKVV